MYYEEKWIDGVLHYRTSPRDEFRPVQVTQAWLSERATPPAGAGEAERIDAAAKALFVGEGHPEAEWLTRCNVEPWRQKARAILAAAPPLPEAVAWTLVASALREYANDIEHEGPVYALGRFAPKSLRQWAEQCEAQEGHNVTAAKRRAEGIAAIRSGAGETFMQREHAEKLNAPNGWRVSSESDPPFPPVIVLEAPFGARAEFTAGVTPEGLAHAYFTAALAAPTPLPEAVRELVVTDAMVERAVNAFHDNDGYLVNFHSIHGKATRADEFRKTVRAALQSALRAIGDVSGENGNG